MQEIHNGKVGNGQGNCTVRDSRSLMETIYWNNGAIAASGALTMETPEFTLKNTFKLLN